MRRLIRRRRTGPLVRPRCERITEHLGHVPGRWHVVYSREPLTWSPPTALGRETIEFGLPSTSSEYGVLELERGAVYGRHGWVVGADQVVLPELSWYCGPNERIVVPDPLPDPVRLEGSCLSLVSDWSCRNYAHFLLDGLGRLALFHEAGFSVADVDWVYCPTPPSPSVAHYFDRLEVPPAKRVWAAPELLVEAEKLFVPSLPATNLTYPSWLPGFLRMALLRGRSDAPSRLLYVSRRGYGREAVGEREVEKLLVDRGFEIYDAPASCDQPADFADAMVVVGAHGAGLANIAFCRPGTRVVELVPTDNAHPFYFSLAHAARLEYGYLVGRSVLNRAMDEFGPSPYDFDVDLDALAAAVR